MRRNDPNLVALRHTLKVIASYTRNKQPHYVQLAAHFGLINLICNGAGLPESMKDKLSGLDDVTDADIREIVATYRRAGWTTAEIVAEFDAELAARE